MSQIQFSAMPNSTQDRHRKKADDHAKTKTVTEEDQQTVSRKDFRLSNFLIFAFGSVGLVFIGLAINYHTKGGYGAIRLGLFWGIIGYVLFGVGLCFAYFEYVVKPAKAAQDAAQKEVKRPRLTVERATFKKLSDGRGFVEVTVRNSGEDIAVKATVHTSIWGRPIEEDKGNECPADPPSGPLETMRSVGNFGRGAAKITGSAVILTKEQVLNVEQQKTRLYVYLVSGYEGETTGKYTLEFYGRYDPITRHFQECPTHNRS